jgi:hypothetical protein
MRALGRGARWWQPAPLAPYFVALRNFLRVAMISALARGHRSGRLYLGLSAASGLGAATLYYIDSVKGSERRLITAELEQRVREEQVKAREYELQQEADLKDAPVLWSGSVTMVDPSLRGYAMLRNVRARSSSMPAVASIHAPELPALPDACLQSVRTGARRLRCRGAEGECRCRRQIPAPS